ncbi:hypothetical protein DNTS_031726 [Danionella cerebrum]|uniref:Flap endonuclease GEN homolog 1 n=1 Tax=Danionella cerebrum TaxID=2873325 RepID=A0A553QB88_9TELE|nr:hypothetical protein DNTS_031726 [Danionella translucida]
MGVHELWSILEPVRQSVPLYSLSGKTLAVDLSLWVCEAQHVQGMMGRVTKPHLRNLFFRVSSLTLMGVKLVFVIEGDAPKIKTETISKRIEVRYGSNKAKSAPKTAKNPSRGRFKAVLRECAELLDCLGVPWVTAAGEAEAMCAFMDSQGTVDGCITNDGDAFLYGARTVYRNFNINSKDPQVDSYQMSRVQDELALSRDTLVGLALLLGCDYIPKGVAGVGKEQALKLIHSLRGTTLLQKFREWSSVPAESPDGLLKKVSHCLVCRHPGSAKAHERRGCVFCASEHFCSPQDYDYQCPCEWHRTFDSHQASALEANIRRKTLASEQFPFTDIISEFLVTKDKPVQPFRRRKPNMRLMQAFALEKMDWPKHYSSEKLLPLLTYCELMNHIHKRESQPIICPIRIYKPRVRNSVSCFEVIWRKPEDYVCADGSEGLMEVRTVEEEALFSSAFPQILQDFHRERREAQENKTKKRKPKAKREQPPEDSHDAVLDLLARMSLKNDIDPEPQSSSKNSSSEFAVIGQCSTSSKNSVSAVIGQCSTSSKSSVTASSPSVSALIGQLNLSSIDWDSSSFTSSPLQNCHKPEQEISDCSLKERIIKKNSLFNLKADHDDEKMQPDASKTINTANLGAKTTLHQFKPAKTSNNSLIDQIRPRQQGSDSHSEADVCYTLPSVSTNANPESSFEKSQIKATKTSINKLKQRLKEQTVTKTSLTLLKPECEDPKMEPGVSQTSLISNTAMETTINQLRPAENLLLEQLNLPDQTKDPHKHCVSAASVAANANPQNKNQNAHKRVTKTSTNQLRPAAKSISVCRRGCWSEESDSENKPGVNKSRNKVKVRSKPAQIQSSFQIRAQEGSGEQLKMLPVHPVKVESDESDATVDSPRPLAERLQMRFRNMKGDLLFVIFTPCALHNQLIHLLRRPKVKMSMRRRMKASEREKLRMRSLAEALHQLRDYLPAGYSKQGQPLTKIQTLKSTIQYIKELASLLEHE